MQALRFILEELNYRWQCWCYRLRHGSILRKVVINGSPKSGTTWMRQLLSSVPGHHYVGNFRDELHKFDAITPGAIVHSHHAFTAEFAQAMNKNDIRVIYMLRDPRDRCISHLFHALRAENHAHHADLKALNQHDQLLACMGGLTNIIAENWTLEWLHTTQAWLDSGFPFCLVRYENLLAKPEEELRRVFEFLELPVSDGLLKAIIKQNRFERKTIRRHLWKKARKPGEENTSQKLRKGIKGDWENYFHQTHVSQFKRFGNKHLIAWGYEKGEHWGVDQPE